MTKQGDFYFISTTSHSGDLLGADLILEIKELIPQMTVHGICGQAMETAAVNKISSFQEWNSKGFFHKIKHFAQTKSRKAAIFQKINELKPIFAILIDTNEFHLELAEHLKKLNVQIYHYSTKSIKSLGRSEIKALTKIDSQVLGTLESDSEFADRNNIDYKYVGSPHKTRTEKVQIERDALDLPSDRTIVACLPGSNYEELQKTMPKFIKVAAEFKKSVPDSLFVIPIAANLERERVSKLSDDLFTFVDGMSLEVMASADLGLVTKGMSSIECALLGTPFATISSKKVKMSHVNRLAKKQVAQEFKHSHSPKEIASHLISLHNDKDKKERILNDLQDIRMQLHGKAAQKAAAIIAKTHGPKNRSKKR